jgi:TonB family protein
METQINRRSVLAALISSLCFFRGSELNSRQRDEESKQNCIVRKFTAPFYPPAARQIGIEGKVTAVAHIARNGTVSAVTDFDGHVLFQSAVEGALKEWQFQAPNDQGQIQITFQFVFKGTRDEKVLNYKVSGTLPSYIEIEVNPFPNTYS